MRSTIVSTDAYCQEIVRSKARSFYFASRFLPDEKRREVFALYAFCRTVDDLADCPPRGYSMVEIDAQLAQWRAWLQDRTTPCLDPTIGTALAPLLQRQVALIPPLIDLVDGMRHDLMPRHLPDVATLEHYCYEVAGTVGLAMASLLGAQDERAMAHARDLGIAMQMTNVLRDIGEDLVRGRIYLPVTEMARFAYTRNDLERGVIDDRFIALMRHQIASARRYYASGLDGLRYLPPDSQFPIAIAARTYAGILGKIERAGYDVFTRRAHTRRHEKLMLLARLYAHHRRGAF